MKQEVWKRSLNFYHDYFRVLELIPCAHSMISLPIHFECILYLPFPAFHIDLQLRWSGGRADVGA